MTLLQGIQLFMLSALDIKMLFLSCCTFGEITRLAKVIFLLCHKLKIFSINHFYIYFTVILLLFTFWQFILQNLRFYLSSSPDYCATFYSIEISPNRFQYSSCSVLMHFVLLSNFSDEAP